MFAQGKTVVLVSFPKHVIPHVWFKKLPNHEMKIRSVSENPHADKAMRFMRETTQDTDNPMTFTSVIWLYHRMLMQQKTSK